MRAHTVHFRKLFNLLLILSFAGLSGCALPGSYFADDSRAPENIEIKAINAALLASPEATSTASKSRLSRTFATPYDYKIGVGDILNIIVWDHPELSIPQGSQRNAAESGNWVHADGMIFYPYVGKLKVAGKSVVQVRELLTARLKQYIRSPQVDVSIAAFRSQRVHVTGAVKKPTEVGISNVPLTLISAINQAGGLQDLADWEHVSLIRNGQEFQYSVRAILEDGDLNQDIQLKHGDLIHVPDLKASKAYVLGEVNKPSTIQFARERVSLIDALSQSGGLDNTNARTSGVFVFRQQDKITQVFQLDASNAAAYLLAERFNLKPKDIVFVTSLPIARWNRLISQLMPTFGLYRGLSGIRDDFINRNHAN